jgi:hypothetical protein
MECKRCLLTSDVTNIVDGVCDFCRLHDHLEKQDPAEYYKVLNDIYYNGAKVLIGISGGMDSSYLLWYTVKVLKIKPLVLHFDNGWNADFAEKNMSILVTKLGVDLVRVYKDEYYDKLCGALLKAGVKDLDIANDMYMADIMQQTAKRYGIKYVFNGHDFRNEGSTPLAWTYMDAKYIKSVYKWAWGEELNTKHIQTLWKQVRSGVKQVRVFHYVDIPEEERVDTMLDFGLEAYRLKHGENDYTKFMGYYMLPKYWNIDKRIVYLSAKVRGGYITKEEGMELLKEPTVEYTPGDDIFYDISEATGFRIGDYKPERTYKDFDHYNFKRFKWLLKILTKLKIFPVTFYKKYAQ